MKMDQIFNSIKEEFCALWTFKQREETLEVVTAYSTTTNKFVSVFITVRDKEFVISDGGWLQSDEYATEIDFDDLMFSKVLSFYENHYQIKKTKARRIEYYFKKTTEAKLIPALVYDLSNFIAAISSASQIQFQDPDEKQTKKLFEGHARQFISSLATNKKRNIYFRKSLDNTEQLKAIRFSVVSEFNSQLTLINYVTGSTIEYFTNSIAKANIMFEVSSKSPFKENIKNKIALIDDQAAGYQKKRLGSYLERLSATTGKHNIMWHQREKLSQFLTDDV